MKPSIFNCVMKCFDMKKLLKSSQATLMMILAGIAIISGSSYSIDEAMAFPHASLIIDPEDEHANDIQIVVGHTNEPAFGKLPGIHDGKHNLEVELSDAATTLPIQEANITADKYYFKDLKSFQRAQSLDDADAIQKNVTVSAVFGQPGTFYNRQVIDPGIYGYTIRGTINYYDVALVPFEATKFCSIPGEDLTKFDTVIFVDASLKDETISFKPLALENNQPPSVSHHINAAVLTGLAKILYSANTRFYICAIGGNNFEIGHVLSEKAMDNALEAVSFLTDWVQSND